MHDQFPVTWSAVFDVDVNVSLYISDVFNGGAKYSSVVRAFVHGAMGRRIDSSWGGPIELFLVQASDPRLV